MLTVIGEKMSEKNYAAEFDIKFRYSEEKKPALVAQGEIEKGKCIVLCGGSGCGKTTLLRCLNGLVPTFYDGLLKGFCRLNGRDTGDMSIGEVGELAASVFQDPRSQFFTVNSCTEIAFGLENFGVPREEIIKRTNKAFSVFDMEKLRDRNVYELSCGERQLVSILAAWASDADIMLLDEPTANLDHAAVERFRKMLFKLKEQGKTLILSEHRLCYLSGIADEYWLIDGGEIKHRFTAEEMAAKSIDELTEMSLRTTDLSLVKMERREKSVGKAKFDFSAENIGFRYKNGSDVLNRISVNAKQGEVIAIAGSNGCGKTTFGKIISGLLKPISGSVLYNGQKMKTSEMKRNVMFVMQEAEFQFFTNSVINELRYGSKEREGLSEEIERLLKKTGMWEMRDRHPFSLSGGQMQRLSLMLAYLSPKPVVILDEPTAGLDAANLESCGEIIAEMSRSKLVFIITHDIELMAKVCTRCICISEGKSSFETQLTGDSELHSLTAYMNENFRLADNARTQKKKPAGRIDPRTKLLYWLTAMTVVSSASNPLVYAVSAAVFAMMLFDGFAALSLCGAGIFSLLLLLDKLFPDTVMSFLAVYFPRLLSAGMVFWTLIGRDEASRTVAALRKCHIPERIIMICSVVFRFFPTLSEDMKLMNRSIETRGAFSSALQKLKAFPEYIEIHTVPMALRVIRIAEALSASAETRGIDLKRKRSSYISVHFRVWDILFTAILIATVIVGVLF